MKERLGLIGTIKILKFEQNKLIDIYEQKNLITNDGLNYLLKLIGGDITGGINKIAIGSGNTIATKEDKNLENKIILLDVIKDYSVNGKVNFMAKIPENTFTTTQNYKEVGLVYKNTTEILVSRLIFDDVIYQKPENSLSVLYSLELQV